MTQEVGSKIHWFPAYLGVKNCQDWNNVKQKKKNNRDADTHTCTKRTIKITNTIIILLKNSRL